jgi:multiple sugar transport system substrate-binding protein
VTNSVTSSTAAATSSAAGARSAISAYYLTTGNKEQDSLWPGFFAQFSAEQPSITVEASGAPDMLQKLTTLIAGGTPPDWAWDDGQDVAPLGYKGALLDLEPYLARDKVQTDAFWPGGWAMSTVRGKRLAVPVNIDPQMLFFNKSLFQAAGVSTPLDLQAAKSWDWQHFRDAAVKLTKRPPGTTGAEPLADVYGFELPISLPWSLPWFRTWGGEILNADLTQPTLSSPGMLAAVEAFVGLSVQDRSAFPPGIPKAPSFIAMEQAGREAMVWAWDSRVAIWRAVHYDWDVIGVVPTATNGPQSLLGGNPAFLFAGAKNKDAAWTLSTWCITAAPNLQIGVGYGSVPSLRANLPTFKETLRKQGKPANLNAYDEALQVAQPTPSTPAFNDLQAAWGKAITPVWLGQADPKTVLASLTTQFTAALAKYA